MGMERHMRSIPSNTRRAGRWVVGCALVLTLFSLGACSSEKMARTFGLTRDSPDEYTVTLEENMIVALEINHLPVKLEHLLRVTDSGVEILSTYQLDPELVPA